MASLTAATHLEIFLSKLQAPYKHHTTRLACLTILHAITILHGIAILHGITIPYSITISHAITTVINGVTAVINANLNTAPEFIGYNYQVRLQEALSVHSTSTFSVHSTLTYYMALPSIQYPS